MALVCHVSRWFELGVLHLIQTKLSGRGRSVRWVEKEGRKERKKEKKKRKKERKKKGRGNEGKDEELVCTPTGRFFSYLGYLCLGAIQWPWSLAPTWGLVQNSLGQTVVCFLGIFYA